ncbi:MAG: cupin domain-containing protein [Pseudomonadota bacterium]
MASKTALEDRLVRYADLRPCYNAFIDTRTPGSEAKENFTIIGPGVSENPNQHVHIAEPHGFNIGGARQPPGCVNSQHSHDTAEVFLVHSGTWRFDMGEHGDDARVTLEAGDIISIPTGIFRGFTNVGDDTGYLFAILGEDDPGRVTWAPKVFEMAKDYGLVLLETGRLIDKEKGETVPDDVEIMPPPRAEDLASMKVISQSEADALVWRAKVRSTGRTDVIIGPDGYFDWPHGFIVKRLGPSHKRPAYDEIRRDARVVFIQNGHAKITIDDGSVDLSTGDTFSVPPSSKHRIEAEDGTILLVVDRVRAS